MTQAGCNGPRVVPGHDPDGLLVEVGIALGEDGDARSDVADDDNL
mgnify:CR=1 FL=1